MKYVKKMTERQILCLILIALCGWQGAYTATQSPEADPAAPTATTPKVAPLGSMSPPASPPRDGGGTKNAFDSSKWSPGSAGTALSATSQQAPWARDRVNSELEEKTRALQEMLGMPAAPSEDGEAKTLGASESAAKLGTFTAGGYPGVRAMSLGSSASSVQRMSFSATPAVTTPSPAGGAGLQRLKAPAPLTRFTDSPTAAVSAPGARTLTPLADVTFADGGAFSYGGVDTLFLIVISSQLLRNHTQIYGGTNKLLAAAAANAEFPEPVRELAALMSLYSPGAESGILTGWLALIPKSTALLALDNALNRGELVDVARALIRVHCQLLSLAVQPGHRISPRWSLPFNDEASLSLFAITYRLAQYCQARHLLFAGPRGDCAALWKSYLGSGFGSHDEVEATDPMYRAHLEEGILEAKSVQWTSSWFATPIEVNADATWVDSLRSGPSLDLAQQFRENCQEMLVRRWAAHLVTYTNCRGEMEKLRFSRPVANGLG